MKLYYAKGACSLAPHIALEEIGKSYEKELIRFDQAPPADFIKANELGAVPVLIMDNGEPLREAAVILQYLADVKPELKLAPTQGSLERLRMQEWLNFISTEMHKGFAPLFAVEYMTKHEPAQHEIREYAKQGLAQRLDIISHRIGSRNTLLSSGFSVADIYLFVVLSWANPMKIDLKPWPAILGLMENVRSRPATQRALKDEHLI
jgi:glutathione S-transferase